VVKLLLDRGAKPDAGTTTDNARALHFAVRRGSRPTVLLLLEAGADPNLRSTFQQAYGTPREIARGIGNEEMVTLLLRHGAK
jgi:ankyrin repeat protein